MNKAMWVASVHFLAELSAHGRSHSTRRGLGGRDQSGRPVRPCHKALRMPGCFRAVLGLSFCAAALLPAAKRSLVSLPSRLPSEKSSFLPCTTTPATRAADSVQQAQVPHVAGVGRMPPRPGSWCLRWEAWAPSPSLDTAPRALLAASLPFDLLTSANCF